MNVLIVSNNAVSKVLNNGKTQENIFNSFQKDNLYQLFVRPQSSDLMDMDFCDSYFLIHEKEMIFRRSNCGSIFTKNDCQHISKDVKKYDSLVRIRSGFSLIIREMLWLLRLWRTKSLSAWLEDIKPQIIFFDAGNLGGLHILVRHISNKMNIPYVVYNSDDYIINPKVSGLFSYFHKSYISYQYAKTYKESKENYCINKYMCDSYATRFNKKFNVLTNSVEVESPQKYTIKNVTVISYFGGIHLNRWRMLARLSKLLPANTILNVYTFNNLSSEQNKVFADAGVVLKEGLKGAELNKAIIESDILLHVESDDEINKSLTMLSMSTKIPEYLMAGRLVLGFGPEEVASMRFLKDNEVGIVLDSLDADEKIEENLKRLVLDRKSIAEYSFAAHEFASNNFDKQVISEDFRKSLFKLLINK
ncbi:hypothetical protein [Marinifilum flexuosum]|uniref:hypothetical protein n=1 Tax=Marinifilum flexuosum TaxID=1117708 RepID=UPI002493B9BB|nr:hypothetical protein [Marinifilum flexuosum]